MWELLFKQLGIKPDEVKQQALQAQATIIAYDKKLDKIIYLLKKLHVDKNNHLSLPQPELQPLSEGNHHER